MTPEQIIKLKKGFEEFNVNSDEDQKGMISKDDLETLLRDASVKDKPLREMMSMIDADEDGNINFDQFCKMEQGYNELCDIWSVGVIAYLLLTGGLPFIVHDEQSAEQRFQDFIKCCRDGTEDKIFQNPKFIAL